MNYKSFTYSELEDIFKNISFKQKPFLHQLITFTFVLSKELNKVFLFHDIGLGKTYTALHLLKIWNVKNQILVICPNSVIKTWKEQITKYTDYTYDILTGTRQERLSKMFKSKAKILIINYEGLKVIGGIKDKKGFKLNIANIKLMGFEAVIADECHRYKNPDSLQTRISHMLVKRARYSILMTGTPISKSAIDLFGQCYVLDDGATFGVVYNHFLSYFYYKPIFQYDWIPKRLCNICNELYTLKKEHLAKHSIDIKQYREKYPKEKTSEDLVLEAVKDISLTYRREECLDLPAKIYEERSVYANAEQQTWIMDIIAGIKIEEIKKTLDNNIIRLLQVTGGTIIHGDKKIYTFADNPKIKELNNLFDEIPGQVIIYHLFIEEGTLIQRLLDKKKMSYSLLNGRVKNKEEQIDLFMNGKSKVLIAHPKSGGEGLNLQMSNTMIFYSSGYMGTTLREQAEGRIHRAGQNKTCFYIDIVMEDTIDRILIDSLKNRTDYVKDVLNYLSKGVKR